MSISLPPGMQGSREGRSWRLIPGPASRCRGVGARSFLLEESLEGRAGVGGSGRAGSATSRGVQDHLWREHLAIVPGDLGSDRRRDRLPAFPPGAGIEMSAVAADVEIAPALLADGIEADALGRRRLVAAVEAADHGGRLPRRDLARTPWTALLLPLPLLLVIVVVVPRLPVLHGSVYSRSLRIPHRT